MAMKELVSNCKGMVLVLGWDVQVDKDQRKKHSDIDQIFKLSLDFEDEDIDALRESCLESQHLESSAL